MQKSKYPLTNEAKIAATSLVEAWDNGSIDQYIKFVDSSEIGNPRTDIFATSGILKNFSLPRIGILTELSTYGLVSITKQVERKRALYIVYNVPSEEPPIPTNEVNHYIWELVLLQELRNAVENDFEVSDYFLTVNAVGTIIHGDYIAYSGSSLQSSGVNYGLMTFNDISALADGIRDALGSAIDEDEELRALINEAKSLHNPSLQKQRNYVSKMLSTLNQRIGTMANAAGAIQLTANFLAALEKLAEGMTR